MQTGSSSTPAHPSHRHKFRNMWKFFKADKMVMKSELCRFVSQKIYPGMGIRFIHSDSQVFLFANSKCKRYFHNKLKLAKLTLTVMYRKQHKKDGKLSQLEQ